MSRLCLISFILLCNVLTSENAFSRKWDRTNLRVKFEKNKSVNLSLQFYECSTTATKKHTYLANFEILYIDDQNKYFTLVKGSTDKQEHEHEQDDMKWVNILYQKYGEKIDFLNSTRSKNNFNKIWVMSNPGKYIDGTVLKTSMTSVIDFVWTLPTSIKHIKAIKIKGILIEDKEYLVVSKIDEIYPNYFL